MMAKGTVKNASITHDSVNIHHTKTKLPTPICTTFLLSMFGGLLGVVFGLILSYALCHVLGTTFVLNGGAIALGVGFSAVVGILFGWAPARKASKLNPIDALRSL